MSRRAVMLCALERLTGDATRSLAMPLWYLTPPVYGQVRTDERWVRTFALWVSGNGRDTVSARDEVWDWDRGAA